MANIAILASGNGSNFEALADTFDNDKENEIRLLIYDRKKAFVSQRARRNNIPAYYLNFSKEKKDMSDSTLIKLFNENKIDIIVLAGFMRILSKFVLENIKVPIVNIHPALLPKYKGLNAIERAFHSTDQRIGITIHYVVEEVDSGEIILQKSIKLRRSKGLEQVIKDIHKLEHKWYPYVIKKLCVNLNSRKNL